MNLSTLPLFILIQAPLFASISDDLTTYIESNDIEGIINTIDSASQSSVSLSDMLSDAQTALNNTTAPIYNNAARRYLYDFQLRPTISSANSNVLYADPSLFTAGQIGFGYNLIMTTDRIIFPTLQSTMNYVESASKGQWFLVANQAFYDENVTIPAGQAITWIGVGGVVIGNGGADQFSSTTPRTVTWQLNDSANVPGVTPSLVMQATPFGDGGYRNMPYMSNFTIGNYFVTQITGSITSSPFLDFESVYLWSGMGSTPLDIGPINMIVRNVRSGGSVNFTSANIESIESSSLIPAFACTSLGNVTDTLFFGSVTAQSMSGLIKDTFFGQTAKMFSINAAPQILQLNVSTNYWWTTKSWTTNAGTVVQVVNQ